MLTAACVRCSAAAAPLTVPTSATHRKARSRWGSRLGIQFSLYPPDNFAATGGAAPLLRSHPRAFDHDPYRRQTMTRDIQRRDLLKLGANLGLASTTLAFPALHALAQERKFAGKTVRILTWSDDTGLAVLRNIAQTFEAQTGARVIADRTGSTSEMVAKLKAAGSRAQYD